MTNLDIWSCANLLLKPHRGEAMFIASNGFLVRWGV
jgi:hypothetical protein